MSEQYEEYGDYEEYANEQGEDGYDVANDAQQQAEDWQTKVELQYYQIEEMLRKNDIQKCISHAEKLYETSAQKQLKNWKVKILNFLLQIYCRSTNVPKIKQTLERISELNKKESYTQNSIKSIILTIKSLPAKSFNENKEFVYGFINKLDNLGKIRSYLLFLEKSVEENTYQESERLINTIKQILNNTPNIPSNSLLQLFSFEIVHSKKNNKDISSEIRKIQLKLPGLEQQSYMNQNHISIIKETVAKNLYLEDNFKECALYLCHSFQENMKYGKSVDIRKNLLKINVLIALLADDKEVYLKEKFNSLYNESAASFKSDNDVQCLYEMIQAWSDCDYVEFIKQSKAAQLKFQKPYNNLLQVVVTKLKTKKLLQIIKPYTVVKLSYIQKRLDTSKEQVEKMLFSLITDNKIHGRIRHEAKESYLDINSQQDQFLSIQLLNIKQIAKRYL